MSRREPGEHVSELELAALLTAPSCARRYTRAVLDAWQVCPDTAGEIALMVTELVTNAVQALQPESARPRLPGPDATERICLTLRLLPGRVVIEVFDHDPNPPVLAEAGEDAESGRGLMLVQALSKEWGYQYPPAGGKFVFAIVGVSAEGERE